MPKYEFHLSSIREDREHGGTLCLQRTTRGKKMKNEKTKKQ
jgi:hypothetical protein